MSMSRVIAFLFLTGAIIWVTGCAAGSGGGGGGGSAADMASDGTSDDGDGGNSDSEADGNTGDESDASGGGSEDNSEGSQDGQSDQGTDDGSDSGVDDSPSDDGTDDGSSDGSQDDGIDDIPTNGSPGDGSDDDPGDVSTDGSDDDSEDPAPPSGTWSELSQPCGGTQTNAMWFDSRDHGYIGCGENAEGAGLYVTDDGGETWVSQPMFEEVRINDIRRASNGALYAAGYDPIGDFQVFEIDESGAVRSLIGLYQASNSAFTAVSQGENIAITNDGQFFVDSLTGDQSAYLAAGAPSFVELETFLDGDLTGQSTSSEQMSRAIAHNNRFWAVGSRINQPATLYYPSTAPGATYHMSKLELQPSNQDGELHDIYVWSETSALVAGFDQSFRYPLIYRLNGDPGDPASWTQIDLFDFGIEYQGGAWKMAVLGDEVVIVGQTFPTNQGFVIRSFDRGATWQEISPVDQNGDFAVNLLTNAWLFVDGTILAAGESYELWRYNP